MNILNITKEVYELSKLVDFFYKELEDKPVGYYSHYKFQKNMQVSGRYNLSIMKFDYTQKDFRNFLNIDSRLNRSFLYYQGRKLITSGSSICVAGTLDKKMAINNVGNSWGYLTDEYTSDMYFNLSLEYDLPFDHSTFLQILDLHGKMDCSVVIQVW